MTKFLRKKTTVNKRLIKVMVRDENVLDNRDVLPVYKLFISLNKFRKNIYTKYEI